MLRILMVDDYPIARKGLIELLREEGVAALVGEAADEAQGLARLQAEAWDACVLDVTLPGTDPIELLARVKAAYPSLPVLMLGFFEDESLGATFIAAGAAAYVAKTISPAELAALIRSMTRGGSGE